MNHVADRTGRGERHAGGRLHTDRRTLRTSSNRDQSHLIVWVRPDREKMELMIGVAQPNNGVVTRFKLSESKFRQWLDHEEARTASR